MCVLRYGEFNMLNTFMTLKGDYDASHVIFIDEKDLGISGYGST